MNCQTIQRRLLGVEDPGRPPPDVQAHLDGCSACRAWQARLVQVERSVRLLTVPESRGAAAFVQQLLQPEVAAANGTPAPEADRPTPAAPRSRRVIRRVPSPAASRAVVPFPWRITAAAAAASVLLFGLAWWAVRDPGVRTSNGIGGPRPDPLVAHLVKQDLKLASAKRAEERAEALKAIDDELSRERQALSGDAEGNGLVEDFVNWQKSIAEAVRSLNKFPAANAMTSVPVGPKADAARVRQLQRNRGLIEALVATGVRLAAEPELLKRVTFCGELAKCVALEIKDAASKQDGWRAVELGNHFKQLVCNGVADNLDSFRSGMRPDSAAVEDVTRVRDDLSAITHSLERDLVAERDAAAGVYRGDMEKVLGAVQESRERVGEAAKIS